MGGHCQIFSGPASERTRRIISRQLSDPCVKDSFCTPVSLTWYALRMENMPLRRPCLVSRSGSLTASWRRVTGGPPTIPLFLPRAWYLWNEGPSLSRESVFLVRG